MLVFSFLYIIVPPINVKIEAVCSTWIALCWEQVETSAAISNQTIIVSGGGSERNVTVESSRSSANVTGLLPGTVFSLRVVAVADDGRTSFPSIAVTETTLEEITGEIITVMIQRVAVFEPVKSPPKNNVVKKESTIVLPLTSHIFRSYFMHP